jgi:hypothetical protein
MQRAPAASRAGGNAIRVNGLRSARAQRGQVAQEAGLLFASRGSDPFQGLHRGTAHARHGKGAHRGCAFAQLVGTFFVGPSLYLSGPARSSATGKTTWRSSGLRGSSVLNGHVPAGNRCFIPELTFLPVGKEAHAKSQIKLIETPTARVDAQG